MEGLMDGRIDGWMEMMDRKNDGRNEWMDGNDGWKD